MRGLKKISLAMVLVFAFGINVQAKENVRLQIDGIYTAITKGTVVKNGSTYFELNEICSLLGVNVQVSEDKLIKLNYFGQEASVYVNANKVTLENGTEIFVQNYPITNENDILIHIRFFEEVFGINVGWNADTQSINVTTTKEYTIDSVERRVGETFTVDTAYEKAMASQKTFKTLKENIETLEESLDDLKVTTELCKYNLTRSNIKTGTDYIAALKAQYKAEKSLRTYEIQLIKQEASLKQQIKNSFVNIINAENSLYLSKRELENTKFNLEITKKKYELGQITLISLENTQKSYDRAVSNIESQQKAINKSYEDLNKLMGEEKTKFYSLDYKVSYETLPESFNIEQYIADNVLKNYNLELKEINLNSAQQEYDWNKNYYYDLYFTYSELNEDSVAETIKASEENIEDLKETYSEAIENMEESIENLYDSIINLQNDYNDAVKSLEDAEKAYDLALTKYDLGYVTSMDVRKAEIAVESAKISIQKITFQQEAKLFSLYNSNIL